MVVIPWSAKELERGLVNGDHALTLWITGRSSSCDRYTAWCNGSLVDGNPDVGNAEHSDGGGSEGEGAIGPKLMSAMKIARELLPGDSRFGGGADGND